MTPDKPRARGLTLTSS